MMFLIMLGIYLIGIPATIGVISFTETIAHPSRPGIDWSDDGPPIVFGAIIWPILLAAFSVYFMFKFPSVFAERLALKAAGHTKKVKQYNMAEELKKTKARIRELEAEDRAYRNKENV